MCFFHEVIYGCGQKTIIWLSCAIAPDSNSLCDDIRPGGTTCAPLHVGCTYKQCSRETCKDWILKESEEIKKRHEVMQALDKRVNQLLYGPTGVRREKEEIMARGEYEEMLELERCLERITNFNWQMKKEKELERQFCKSQSRFHTTITIRQTSWQQPYIIKRKNTMMSQQHYPLPMPQTASSNANTTIQTAHTSLNPAQRGPNNANITIQTAHTSLNPAQRAPNNAYGIDNSWLWQSGANFPNFNGNK